MQGYSYVAPSVVFGREHVLTEDLLITHKPNHISPSYYLSQPSGSKKGFFDVYKLNMSSPSLGDGSFSTCRRCVQITTGKEFAVKIISRK